MDELGNVRAQAVSAPHRGFTPVLSPLRAAANGENHSSLCLYQTSHQKTKNQKSNQKIPSTCLDLGSELNSHGSDDQVLQAWPTEAVCLQEAQALLTCALGFPTPPALGKAQRQAVAAPSGYLPLSLSTAGAFLHGALLGCPHLPRAVG